MYPTRVKSRIFSVYLLCLLCGVIWTCANQAHGQANIECGFASAVEAMEEGVTPPYPTLSGPELTIYTGYFMIHYTLQGSDATTVAWAESVAVFAGQALTRFQELNWNPPPRDNDGTSYQIYILDEYNRSNQSAWGETVPENIPVAPNQPNTTLSWVQIQKDSIWRPYPKYEQLKAVVAHELHHAVQMSYRIPSKSTDGGELWFHENTSTYMERAVYPSNTTFLYRFTYGSDPISLPHFPILSIYSRYQYGGCLWPRFLDERYGLETVRHVWEILAGLASFDPLGAIDSTLRQSYSTDIVSALREYAVWRYFTGTRADTNHFSIADLLPTAPIRRLHTSYPASGDQYPDIDYPGGTNYIAFSPGSGSFDVSFDGQDGHTWAASLVGVVSAGQPAVTEVSLNANGFGSASMQWSGKSQIVLAPIVYEKPEQGSAVFSYCTGIITSPTAITFQNRRHELPTSGALMTLNAQDTIAAWGNRTLQVGSAHSLTEWTERFSADSLYKHHHWNTSVALNKLNRQYTVEQSLDQSANFNSVSPATIKATLVDGGASGGTIGFRDPWYVEHDGNQPDTLKSFSTPFSPTGAFGQATGGVFLYEGFPSWNAPYYSLSAPNSNTIAGFSSTFLNWRGDPDSVLFQDSMATATGIVFKRSGATARALYKAHLGSGTAQGFATSGQRRLVRDENGGLHVVYASGGCVWYTRSTNGGSTWTAEIRVNPEGTQAKCPALTGTNDGGTNVLIAYETDCEFLSPGITLARYSGIQRLWSESVAEVASYSLDANPALYCYSTMAELIYKTSSEGGLEGMYYTLQNGEIQSSTSFSVPGTDAGSTNPALARPAVTGVNSHLVFQQGDTAVYYLDFGSIPPQGTPVNISSGSACSTNRWPSIAVNYAGGVSMPMASWTGHNGYTTVAVIRRKLSGGWSTFYKTGGYLGGGTEVGGTTNSTLQAIIGWWNTYSNQTQFIRLINGNYSSIYNLPSNGDFHITDAPDFSSMKAALFYSAGSLPYPLRPLAYNFLSLGKAGETERHSGREAIVSLSGVELGYSLGDVTLDGSLIEFIPQSEALPVSPATLLGEALATRPFHLTRQSSLLCPVRFTVVRPERAVSLGDAINAVGFATELVSVADGKAVAHFAECSPQHRPAPDSTGTVYELDCSGVKEGEYYLRVAVHAPGGVTYSLADLQYERVQGMKKAAAEPVDLSHAAAYPTEYALDEPYPNPFNPLTTLKYALPAAGEVSLVVLDVLGREVALLANGSREAGYYSATWNATEEASGVYFAHLTVKNELGSVIFTKVNKLLLVK